MKYRVLDAEEAYGLAGTSLQGHVRADYETLVEFFGKPDPNMCDGYKTDVEWCVEVEEDDGHIHIISIYNWKNGENYLGREGMRVWDMKDWNIGGRSFENASPIRKILSGGEPPVPNET